MVYRRRYRIGDRHLLLNNEIFRKTAERESSDQREDDPRHVHADGTKAFRGAAPTGHEPDDEVV